ncbi:MAG: cytochrome c oxidase assembly protein [Thermomicrobium sp.]|nr:cytochrome c oxidase assembly protein [Thermomicrobium sp.]
MGEPLVRLPAGAWLDPGYWTWRLPVLVVLGIMASTYLVGAVRLQRRGAGVGMVVRGLWWACGIALLGLALLSPLDELGGAFFSWHMIQHLALLYAAPLLLAGWPFSVTVWSFPGPVRRSLGRLFGHGGPGAVLLDAATRPRVALAAGIASLWLWHYPPLYDAVLTRRWLHDLEHVTFFLGAVLYWWPVVGAPPVRSRFGSDAGRALYLVLGGVQSGILGALVTFWPDVLYHRYLLATVDRSRLLADQVFGGLAMWLSGPIVVAILALATLGREVRQVATEDVLAPH